MKSNGTVSENIRESVRCSRAAIERRTRRTEWRLVWFSLLVSRVAATEHLEALSLNDYHYA